MTPKGFAFGLLLLLLCVSHHIQLAQADDACTACGCSGTAVDCSYRTLSAIPSGIPVTTTQLSLQGNQLTSISADAFTGLTALSYLYLQTNQITSISASTFTTLSALTVLYLNNNLMTSIPVNAFANLTALKYLYLSSNLLTSISAAALTGLSALTQLYLLNNQITSIPTQAFPGLTALTYLALDNNQIANISANAFTGLTALTRLALDGNPFTTLPPGLFKGLAYGLYLSASYQYLSPNNFTFDGNTVAPPSTYGSASHPYPCDPACATCYALGSGSCCGTNCLTCSSSAVCTLCYEGYFSMGSYCLASAATNASITSVASVASVASVSASSASIASQVSASATSVVNACGIGGLCICSDTTVVCNGRSLSAIPSGIPINTTILYLNLNQITSISANALTGLTALTWLYLQSNQITSISANAFTGLAALNRLDLSSNQIASISANVFAGLSALTGVVLSGNQFTSMPTSALAGLPMLKSVSLSNNQITSIPATAFAGLTALIGVNLAGNQLRSIPTSAFTGLTALIQLVLPNNQITSISANAFAGLSALTLLHLYNNQITSISANAFSGLTAMTALALNDNPLTTLPPGLFTGLQNGMYLALSVSYSLRPNNFTFDGNTVAPPSTYGSASEPYKCDTACATCYAAGSSSCCGINCLTCTSDNPCTQCYDGHVMMSGFCVSFASIASARTASAASTASASAASVASSIAQRGGGDSQESSSSATAAIAAAVASVAVIAIIAVVFIVWRRRRSPRRSAARSKNSAGPIYQEAVEMTISPLTRATGSQKEEDIAAYAVVGQKQPEPLYQAISTTSTSAEVVYDYASAYVAGSNSRRVREGLSIVKHLASGNFGDVALGQVPFSKLPPRAQALLGPTASETVQVAVKSLKSNADEKSRKDFESEAKLMAPFVHPNVVRLLAALVESEPHLVLLEFVQYGDLRTMLQKSKLHSLWWTQNEQIHAIRQIALGMEYLGTLHFVHRDLAARNCLVGQGMVVKIADFGLSRELASDNDYYRMQTRGKLPVKWMAPETMTFRKFTFMSDVWSFGVTAWECCSYGATPYGKMDGRDTLAHVEAGGRLPMPQTCKPELYTIMVGCWDISPEKRPTFAQLVKGLASLQDGTTVREIGAML
ncbi:tyrosine-protein kinase transforming protein Src, variant [Capsaspora owczarzaki ATCC 30864]|uniref:tyrosine-protein kinase transforming protein Src, variant n=1 Tax=Capsaspora owczarzaki (strain ATCC 30864) TaxID=595528 RepID=UPI0003522A8D|nr:tyrosine-protein kinase transforming protein Src, variant [Capsaspora owczarzaki ATCC 30864]|eukprot:XP_011270316.1 tyrosine-protein kinase transforming protein Src, variant [Capsaspora owczarzaki ATCC 30864]